jgi:hypothetical protein
MSSASKPHWPSSEIIAWRVLYLTMLGRESPELPCNPVFEDDEWQAVYIVSTKQPPPETPPSIDQNHLVENLFVKYFSL